MLSDKRIIEEMQNGNIVIEPFDERQLGANSYDCRIGEWYFVGDPTMVEVRIERQGDMDWYWGHPMNDGRIYIKPDTTILAHTQEVVGGHNGFLAKMHCRSSIARSGISVCRCAGVGDVGYIGRWTMEISNHTQALISIPVGYRICQMIFEEVGETLKQYNGKYGQDSWTPYDMVPKPGKDWDRKEVSSD